MIRPLLSTQEAGLVLELIAEYLDWHASEFEFDKRETMLARIDLAIRTAFSDQVHRYIQLRHAGEPMARAAEIAYGPRTEREVRLSRQDIWIYPRRILKNSKAQASLNEAFEMLEKHWIAKEPTPEGKPPDVGSDTVPV